jgi:RHS repeat-associated protein
MLKSSQTTLPETSAKGAVPPTLSLPKGGGAIRGIGEKFAANPVTGTGSFSVPIYTSAGRAGFGPALSLSYDSGSGNNLFGLGWSCSLPSITRKTDKGLPQYLDDEESDVFVLAGCEDLVPALVQSAGQWHRQSVARTVGGVDYQVQFYRPRIEGLFARIERWTNVETRVIHWRSITKDNLTTVYGKDNNSRIYDPADSSPQYPRRIFTWLISESYDDKGNAIVYEYKSENAEGVDLSQASEKNRTNPERSVNRYVKRIKYGNRISRLIEPDLSQALWMFEVVFDYGEHDGEAPTPNDAGAWLCRHDPFSSYRAGFEIRTYRLCQRVLMFHHFPEEDQVGLDCLVRSTDFVYQSTRNNPDDLQRGHPVASFVHSITQSGYKRAADSYLKRSLPALEFTYSQAVIQEEVREVDQESLENLPAGLDSSAYQWVDLDGEGISGILSEQANGWFYKRNLSPLNKQNDNGKETLAARFAPLEFVAALPAHTSFSSGGQQFLDLAGDGQIDLVQFNRPLAGYYERTPDGDWSPFKPFDSIPEIAWNDPNVKFVDLTGDGHADILVSEDNVYIWYPSLAEKGFGAAERVYPPLDEEQGPRLVFADGIESIYLADMSGDGLTDLVRVRNSEVCYWPNLGYGRFGAKVTMDNAPLLDRPELFDQRRIRLADIDGSGVTDLLYLGSDGVQIYFNQSGNRWDEGRTLNQVPPTDTLMSVTAIDLLGNGTACLVWSSSLPGTTRQLMRYIDLMGGQKPHLLVGLKNNLGAETMITYAPSTQFYLEDKIADRPWVTRLPFPVHVVERAETIDRISRNRFVTRYAYHQGYFDGREREFRGFGMVEQWDTEQFAALSNNNLLPEETNIEAVSHVPPVLTKTWFHTGAWIEGVPITKQFAHEYYDEGDASLGGTELSPQQLSAMLLDDTVLPDSIKLKNGNRLPWKLSSCELPEAVRALKGSILRQEIYALDGSEESDRPYSVSERSYTVELLQPLADNQHAVLFVHSRESIDFHYERKLYDIGGQKLADPRVAHSMTLAVDGFGNLLESVAISYGRRRDDDDPLMTTEDKQKQRRNLITYIQSLYTNPIDENDTYRTPLNYETRTYEMLQLEADSAQPDITNLYRFDEMVAKLQTANDGFHDIAYENINAAGIPPGIAHRRLIEHARTVYRRDNLSGALPLGIIEVLALDFDTYRLAFTQGLLSEVYQRKLDNQPPENLLPDPPAVLHEEGGYVDIDGDGHWWMPSGRRFYHLDPNATPAEELAQAQASFFQPVRFEDPFLNKTTLSYDQSSTGQAYNLLVRSTLDAVGNQVLVQHDYRVLQPYRVIDANGNRTEAAFDALGMVAGTAVMGKENETLGDSLQGFEADMDEPTLLAHLQSPLDNPHAILNRATTRIVYDLHQYERTSGSANPQPSVVYSLTRETHDADLQAGQLTNIQHNFSYSDGFGREIQKKVQAEPGALDAGGPTVDPRWVGSGWMIFNNKAKPVRQYEPFFSATQEFEFANAVGVSPILFYDPLERVVATLHPNHTYEKVVLDPWHQAAWDMNDTVLQVDPKADPDVGNFFSRLLDAQYLPTWHAQRVGGAFGAQEQSAANKSAVHADTPTLTHFDTLGRTFLTVNHNRFKTNGTTSEATYMTRINFDIEGNQREIIDAKNRVVMKMDYDLTGRQIHLSSMEAGERWVVSDVLSKALYTWDSRLHQAHTVYDALRRAVNTWVRQGNGPDVQVETIIYGEAQGTTLNHRGKVYQHCDGAGIATNAAYDFKGNLLNLSRQFTTDYKTTPNWSSAVSMEPQIFAQLTTYDALNRPVSTTMPDTSLIRPAYNLGSLLERLEVNLHGDSQATTIISDLRYNAKRQHEYLEYGNGVRSNFAYDPLTSRLSQLQTMRGVQPLQDLSYTYDPAGNITAIRDDAQQTIFFNNQVVTPDAEYTYDALYRLIEAKGREHIGQVAQPQTTWDDAFRTNLPHPNDGQAMRRYTERYAFDEVGNLLQLIHQAVNGDWTRAFTFSDPSQIDPLAQSNRLSDSTVGNSTESYDYDAHGNLLSLAHLPGLVWNYQNHLQQIGLSGGANAYYVYDAGGQRARKVIERQDGTRQRQRIYFGGFEVYSEYDGSGSTVTLERETLHVIYGGTSIALIETRTKGNGQPPAPLVRYQLTNHIGSASLEVDADGQIISYEEYYPYGCTSYQAMDGGIEVSAKRYRYTGKERDEESGFYYFGARYYCCYLGRWINPDPGGLVDGLNLYAYVRNNPVVLRDVTGREAEKIPIYWVVAIPAAVRAVKDSNSGIPLKNAMLLLIWARGEQAPNKKDGSPYNPNMHSGRLLNAQPTKEEVKSLCPNYKQGACSVDKADGDYKGAYIYNLKQLLTPDTKEKKGDQGDSAHFGFGDTYSMFRHTLKRIGGEKLQQSDGKGGFVPGNVVIPDYSRIDKKLKDPKMTAEGFFTSDMDKWAFKGYGNRFITDKFTETVPVEVLKWLPKLIKSNEDIIARQKTQKSSLEDEIKQLKAQNQQIVDQGISGEAASNLYSANLGVIAADRAEADEIQKNIDAKTKENQVLEEFQKAVTPTKKK